MIPYGKQQISQQDIDQVIEVLSSDFLTQGPKVPQFEEKFAKKCDANFACATNSATSALHLACLALNVQKGDLVWTSPISFVASANCALYCDADIDFVDIDSANGTMCIKALEHKLLQAQHNNRLPKVVIPVHLAGQSCAMKKIHELAKIYQFKIIEDACHAVGASYQEASVGSCQYSDICVFSFHPVKIITTAEGGLATTNCANLHQKMRLLRSHGITREESEMDQISHGPWYYQQTSLGFNYRLTELSAALGISQLDNLENFIEKRNTLASRYDKLLAPLPCTSLQQSAQMINAYHLYIIKVDPAIRSTVFKFMRKRDIGVNVHYIPIHLQPYYQSLGFKAGDFPQAELFYRQIITLPLYPALTEQQQDSVIDSLSVSLSLGFAN